MSSGSDLAFAVASLRFNNYTALAIITAVVYDYILTLPNEISYVWNRSWSFVSTMFVVVRYAGIATAVTQSLVGTTFFTGPTLVSTIVLLVSEGTFILFLAAADIVMVLRVYAMYNQSKIVLGILLLFYAATIILFSISAAYYNNPNTYMTMYVSQVLDMSFCDPSYVIKSQLGKYKYIPRYTLAGLLFILAVSKLCLDSVQSYRITKEWRTNQYIKLLVREGVLYFIAHIFYIVNFGQDAFGTIMATIAFAGMIVLSPRFIMSVRELYVHNLTSVTAWDRGGLDSGFGLKGSSSRATGMTSVGFAGTTTLYNGSERDIEMHVRLGGITRSTN